MKGSYFPNQNQQTMQNTQNTNPQMGMGMGMVQAPQTMPPTFPGFMPGMNPLSAFPGGAPFGMGLPMMGTPMFSMGQMPTSNELY